MLVLFDGWNSLLPRPRGAVAHRHGGKTRQQLEDRGAAALHRGAALVRGARAAGASARGWPTTRMWEEGRRTLAAAVFERRRNRTTLRHRCCRWRSDGKSAEASASRASTAAVVRRSAQQANVGVMDDASRRRSVLPRTGQRRSARGGESPTAQGRPALRADSEHSRDHRRRWDRRARASSRPQAQSSNSRGHARRALLLKPIGA